MSNLSGTSKVSKGLDVTTTKQVKSLRKKGVSTLTAAFFVLAAICLFGVPAQGALYSGGGTEPDPYIINTPAKMNDIGNNSGHWGGYFLLTADINIGAYTGTSFNIIGNPVTPFTGIFDGNGHTISDFTYTSTGAFYIGLFSYVGGPDAEIKDLALIAPNVDAGTGGYVGTLVGYLTDGTVNGCCAEGGSVSGTGSIVGGLVGYNNSSTVSNSYATGSVTGFYYVGGLVGQSSSSATVSISYATGSVTGTGSVVGGLVGYNNSSTVSKSCATGRVEGLDVLGGLVGYNYYGTASNSYATGTVSETNNIAGGLVGHNFNGTVSNSYATGSVEGAGINVGGLVGFNTGPVTDSFWNTQTSGQPDSAAGTPKTTLQMQTESTFTDAGWDFVSELINGTDDIWRMCVDDVNYPLFSREFNTVDFACPDGVDFDDFAIFGLAWRSEQGDGNWNPDCDISDPKDSVIDELDLVVFVDNWLAGG